MRLLGRPAGVRHRFVPAGPAGLLPWLVAALAFVAGLALAGALTLGDAARGVAAAADGVATVQIVEADPLARARQTAAAKAFLARAPGVEAVREVPRTEIEMLMRPWLGAGVGASDLPLPAMIDVSLKDSADPAALAVQLRKVTPAARLDMHSGWIGPAERTLRGLQVLSLVIAVLVLAATGAMVTLAVRAALDGARPTVELLHMMGAEDTAVSAIFEHRAFAQGATGGVGGAACAALALLLLAAGTVPSTAWLALAVLPLALGLLAAVAARGGVRGALRALP